MLLISSAWIINFIEKVLGKNEILILLILILLFVSASQLFDCVPAGAHLLVEQIDFGSYSL